MNNIFNIQSGLSEQAQLATSHSSDNGTVVVYKTPTVCTRFAAVLMGKYKPDRCSHYK